MQKRKNKKETEQQNPIIYLDTCILRNWLINYGKEDILLSEHIRNKKYDCITSVYSMLELFEISKDRKYFMNSVVEKWTEVNEFLRKRSEKNLKINELEDITEQLINFLKNYSFIQFRNLEGTEDWTLLFDLCSSSNLHLSDNIHLVTAYVAGSTHLVTNDTFFIKEGNAILRHSDVKSEELLVCLPKTILEIK